MNKIKETNNDSQNNIKPTIIILLPVLTCSRLSFSLFLRSLASSCNSPATSLFSRPIPMYFKRESNDTLLRKNPKTPPKINNNAHNPRREMKMAFITDHPNKKRMSEMTIAIPLNAKRSLIKSFTMMPSLG